MKQTLILCALLLSGACTYIFGQTTREEIFSNIEATGGVYYAYPYKGEEKQTQAPKGYTPFYISHYGRHGSRWLIADEDYRWIIDLFEDAHKAKALSELGEDVRSRLSIVWEDAIGHGGDLTPKGVRQHRGIAERMYQSFPEVFKGEPQMSARSTTVIRCVLSMDAFCERLKELNPKLQITRESSNRYMGYLNYHTEEAMKFTAHNGPWREEFRKFEESHIRPDRLVASLFSDKDYIRKTVNPARLMMGLYWVASDMQNTDLSVSFYDIFDKQELFDIWQINNYKNYVCDGPSPVTNGLMVANAKTLLQNILESAEECIAKGTNSATFRFGHDGNVIPLTGLLQLENCYNAETNPDKYYEAWSNFKIVPMAANVQMIFFRKKGSDDILVKFMLNEKEVKIPVKSEVEPYYHWKDVKEFYQKILASGYLSK